uniref:Major facilitator superfamily (MFS) profile domain-containing protein n=1 Tax=Tetraselmis chuii TaxID=63592 RepID=A0A7S1SPW4_9CHLO|mmetsp:Transcript_19224/g.34245  ORF Transcript_19224/g.34245 Transcript_19224/m.34245 type:complete len:440 (+) Transcript_19224:350-1669(+)
MRTAAFVSITQAAKSSAQVPARLPTTGPTVSACPPFPSFRWADFAIFGFFSSEIGAAFFPSADPTAELIKTFSVFAAAFFMRPVGGVIFGHVGDKVGRKPALLISIGLMAFATFGVGCLPTYKQVGIFAPALLLVLRMIQGVSVGGQLVGSFLFTVEAAPEDEKGFYGSLTLGSANGGTLLGSAIAGLLHMVMEPAALAAWGWRIPFWLGMLIGPASFCVKNHIDDDEPHALPVPHIEAPSRRAHCCSVSRNPAVHAVVKYPRALLATIAGTALWTSNNYICLVWIASYLQALHPNATRSQHFGFVLTTVALAVLALAFPLVGLMSDRVGRLRVMMMGAALLMVATPTLCGVLPTENKAATWASMFLLTTAMALYGAPLPSWTVTCFPKEVTQSTTTHSHPHSHSLSLMRTHTHAHALRSSSLSLSFGCYRNERYFFCN